MDAARNVCRGHNLHGTYERRSIVVDIQFVNFYRCPKDCTEWKDAWDFMCNDRCPTCNKEIMPYKSLEIDTLEIIEH